MIDFDPFPPVRLCAITEVCNTCDEYIRQTSHPPKEQEQKDWPLSFDFPRLQLCFSLACLQARALFARLSPTLGCGLGFSVQHVFSPAESLLLLLYSLLF